MLESVPTQPSAGSKRGIEYEVANGVTIPNEGEKHCVAYTAESAHKSLTAHVCGANKALLSVSQSVKKRNRVVFQEEGSYIENRTTGEVLPLREENGMYMLKVWVQ